MCIRPSPNGAIVMLGRRQGYASGGASSNGLFSAKSIEYSLNYHRRASA